MRRRKTRLSWFRPLGSGHDASIETNGQQFDIVVEGNGAPTIVEIPLTFDFTQEEQITQASGPTALSLSDLQNESWRVRRIVGKFFASFAPDGGTDQDETSPLACLLGAAFIVKLASDNGLSAKDNSPIAAQDNTDPWIWRRAWILGQAHSQQMVPNGNDGDDPPEPEYGPTGGVGTGSSGRGSQPDNPNPNIYAAMSFPTTTANYGSVADGPHIDAKTNRIIGPEQRLYFVAAAQSFPIGSSDYHNPGVVRCYLDYRLLGSLMRATNRRNASR